ncbi:MAG: two-component regulator propeller domain-containing protein, partial [Acidobacteriota bacterium]|nr:two-component regulator propeller domain-containing protein [Acidobacteriota bacterium]
MENRKRAWCRATTAILLMAAMSAVHAKERLVRHFDHRDGLPVSFVSQVAQDRDGFLWIGTQGGLVRYDGIEMRPWGRDVTIGSIDRVWTGPHGEIVIREHPSGELLRVEDDTLAPVTGHDGGPLGDVRDAGFSPDGSFLVVVDAAVWRRAGEGWIRAGPERFGGERPYKLGPPVDDRSLVITTGGVWAARGDETIEKIADLDRVVDVQPHPSGSLFVVRDEFPTSVIELRQDGLIEHLSVHDRPVDLALRSDTIWFSHKLGLTALRADGAIESVGTDDFEHTGGFLLVDREGSLWMGSLHGLFQFPEPDTVAWTIGDGLPTNNTRFLVRAEEGLWVSSWGGLALYDGGGWTPLAHTPRMIVRSMPCTDDRGRFWTGVALDEGPSRREGLLRRSGGRFAVNDSIEGIGVRCDTSRDGTVWLSREHRILRTTHDGPNAVQVSRLPVEKRIDVLFEDPDDVLWAGATGTICHAPVAALAEGAWTCDRLPEEHQVRAIVDTPSGTIWAATSGGVFRRVGDAWELVPASRELPAEW